LEGIPARDRHRLENSIKYNITVLECEDADWKQLTQDKVQYQGVVTTVMKLPVP
jgi:hypothetical protein